MTRRQLLRAASLGVLGLAGAALVGCGSEDAEEETPDASTPAESSDNGEAGADTEEGPASIRDDLPSEVTVAVIGAGLAGLRAAQTLAAAGVDVVVLEAQDRAGGRVLTDRTFANFPVERGAEFLHRTATTAWNIARESGFALLDDVEFDLDQDVFVFLRGERLLAADIARDRDLNVVFDADLNFGDLVDVDADTLSVEQAIASLGLGPLATRLLEQDAALEQSGLPSQMSAFAISNEVIAAGGDFRFERGYDQLVDHIGRGLPIFLSTPVESVEWSRDAVEITTANGVIEADHVVITVSVAALRAGLIEFDPPLPAARQDAIDGLGMGFIAKLLLRYDEPFWPEGTSNVLTDGDPQHWWMPAVTREQDDVDAVITGFATQTFADRVAGMSVAQVRDVAAAELVRIFGAPASADHIEDFSFVDWSADP